MIHIFFLLRSRSFVTECKAALHSLPWETFMKHRITKERISVKGGLGPFQDTEDGVKLDILPVTVFIGPQGTGKSLVSQFLYLFRDAEYLLAEYSEYGNQLTGLLFSEYSDMITALFRKIIKGIRGGTHGNLASFLSTPDVYVRYECEYRGNPGSDPDRGISISRDKDEIQPLEPFSEEIVNWLRHWISDPVSSGKISGKAIFVPGERTFYSHFISSNPRVLFGKELPLTTHEFARRLIERHEPAKQADDIERLVSDALGGKVISVQEQGYPRKLQWLPKGSGQPIPITMASSGQMGAWPLVIIAKDIFAKGELPLFLHIEEPEIHLHPKAQVAIVKLLAYLANHGIRIIVTTHSLTVLYALNNLTLAYRQLGDKTAERVPEVSVRLPPDKMAAYLFDTDGKVEKIVDESGQIDEGLLGEVLGNLEIEFNRLTAYNILWE